MKRTTWHYKLLKKYNAHTAWQLENDIEVSLCQYFWTVVGFSALTLFLAAIILFSGSVALVAAINLVGFLLIPVTGVIAPWSLGLAMATIGFSTLASIGIMSEQSGGLKVLPDYISKHFPEKKKEKKEPGLFAQMYKAHKEKFCPMVKLNEED